jgi:Domain of unknown function (DUF4349)
LTTASTNHDNHAGVTPNAPLTHITSIADNGLRSRFMDRLKTKTALALALCALTACEKSAGTAPLLQTAAVTGGVATSEYRVAQVHTNAANDVALRRHIAVRHALQLRTKADAVEAAYRSAQEACAAAACELMASQLTRNDEQRPTQASLDARVPPEAFGVLLAKLSALGSIVHHDTASEDKTDEVIDVEARAMNLAAFRDRLREMIGKSGAKLAELIEVERELVRVQSELDSLASRRKALAGQTEKVRLLLTINAQPAVLEAGAWAPLREAVLDSGRVFARSLAGLVSLITAALPWLAALLAIALPLRAWRRHRRRAG